MSEKRLIAKGHKPIQQSSGGSYFINLPKDKILNAGLKKGEQIYYKAYHSLKKTNIDFD